MYRSLKTNIIQNCARIASSSFLESESSYDWDEYQFDFIPEEGIEQNRQCAQTTTSSDKVELEHLFTDKLFADKEWTAKYEEERKVKRLTS